MHLRLKKTVEKLKGIGDATARSAGAALRRRQGETAVFKDDGQIPNNPRLAFVCYRSAVGLEHSQDPAAVFEELFRSNGWGDSWRNGIYDYPHYHSRTHEVLGVARGQARVRFGGNNGKTIELRAGDVAILPAGTGHQRISASQDFLVVGAYPGSGRYDECTGLAEQRKRALKSIPLVPLPDNDPLYGVNGPLRELWRDQSRSTGQ
jgi:uncharacterized protein YjlB